MTMTDTAAYPSMSLFYTYTVYIKQSVIVK